MSEELKAAHEPCNWDDAQVLEFLGVALRNVDLVGSVRLSEIRHGFEHMRKLYAAQVVSAEQQGGADGWKLVPVEPTPKMIDATWYHEIDMSCGIESQGARNKRIYEAMLAAAPAAPAADAGVNSHD